MKTIVSIDRSKADKCDRLRPAYSKYTINAKVIRRLKLQYTLCL